MKYPYPMISATYRYVYGLLVVLIFGTSLAAQTDISGTINAYSAVTAVDLPNNAVTVSAPGAFGEGEQVLLIQMQGASIAENDDNTFGDITALGGAGSYELGTICAVAGNVLTFENDLVNTDYDPAGALQLISVPRYPNATVSAELTGQAWDGSTGGVVVLIVDKILTLNAPINMDGKGFRGGAFENAVSNCVWFIPVNDQFYNTPNDGGGRKGESIAPFIANKEYGQGPQAAGGGGGNDHNSGGGGGANAGAGGGGGRNVSTGTFNCSGNFPGRPGNTPTLSGQRIFLGSGGGAGDGNNSLGTGGGNGGGIVIILTDNLTVGAAADISANGLAAANTGGGDGAGGGGAGGSIYLQANSVSGAPILSVAGGKGGDVNNEGNLRCFGPGGGGGGGLIRTTVALTAGSLVLTGGSAGESLNTSATGCTGNTGAAGGATGLLAADLIPQGSALSTACSLLPVTWRTVDLRLEDKRTLVSWSVSDQLNNDYFTVERSLDGRTFVPLGDVPAQQETTYQFTDHAPVEGTSFYRIKQTDLDGYFSYSATVLSQRQLEGVRLYPSLATAGQPIRLELPSPLEQALITVGITDQAGRLLWRKQQLATPTFNLQTNDLTPGVYQVTINGPGGSWTSRLVIGR